MQPIANRDPGTRLRELRKTARQYRERYGRLTGSVDFDRAESAMAVRTSRLRRLQDEAARIKTEIDSMSSEVIRIEKWVEFCLEDMIARTKEEHAEGWSPQPVLGFRLWVVHDDALYGVKMPWPGRALVASCLSRGGSEEIPHTDGRCGRLGCGVYAAKSVDPLYTGFDVEGAGNVALGLVALTGKVVEHDSGYRAAVATVVALGAAMGDRLLLTNHPGQIEA
ncbi:MAG: hypothetical protein U9N84_08500, partial [Actinomycetota bacterium]|nr:hypothetical protein [Actinomycetota bacterium]